MLQNYFKITLRNLWKNRLFTVINLTGLSVGIACVMLIFLLLQQILNYDGFHTNGDRIYAIQEASAGERPWPLTVVPALPTLLRTYPAIENGTRVLEMGSEWMTYEDKEINPRVTYVDTGFFQIFTFPLRLGNEHTALKNHNAVVLSDKTAEQLFGVENPIGKTVLFNDKRAYVVQGVMAQIPGNSMIQPQVILPIAALEATDRPLTENWYNSFCPTYLLLRPGVAPASLERQLPGFVEKYYDKAAQQRQLSLIRYTQLFETARGPILKVLTRGLLFVGLFILLVVCINFLNLSSAASLARAQEVAMRTAMGSGRWQIMGQFLLETGLVVLLASGLGTLLLQLVMPSFISYFSIDRIMDLSLNYSVLVVLVALIVVVGSIAGGYPAWHLTSLNVIKSLRGKATTTTTRTPLRNTLVVVQFALAVVLIACTLVMAVQNRFIKQNDLGFSKDDITVVPLDLNFRNPQQARAQIDHLINGLRANPNVLSYSTSQKIPGRYGQNFNSFSPEYGNRKVNIQQITIDENFLPTYGISLIEGRNFLSSLATDTTDAVIINRRAMKAMGWTTAIGKRLRDNSRSYTVVGVVDDYHYQGMVKRLDPLIHFFSGAARLKGNNYLSLKLQPGSESRVLAGLEAGFKAVPARRSFSYFFMKEDFNRQYWVMDQTQRFVSFASGITILLACAGVFGLTAFTIRQRTREIGVRKVLGAGVFSIVSLLSQKLLRLVLIAIAFAVPLTYLMMSKWLQSFTYRIDFPWWVLVLAGFLTVLIALLTVSFQSVKAALMNPVKSLRTE